MRVSWCPCLLTIGSMISMMEMGLAAPNLEVTFHKDVVPILQKCLSCHRPGEVAPMSFLVYQNVLPWTKAIRKVVLHEEMPPWAADPQYGKFSNDRSLSGRD